MYTACWNDCTLASGEDVIEVEQRLYFRAEDVRQDLLRAAPERSQCEWKDGKAEYYDVVVGECVNRAAAWCYPRTGSAAMELAGRFSFWRGVEVSWAGPGPAPPRKILQAAIPNVARALGAASVIWRPTLPPALSNADVQSFSGYLIPDLRVLVDVMATPSDKERCAYIQAARALGHKVLSWNKDHPSEAYGYIAVWGSATPSAEVITALRARAVVLELTYPSEILSNADG
jgi:uncharacterized protein (DUF427 family)